MNRTDTFIQEVSDVLQNNILDFWIKKMTDPSGGFYGQITGAGEVVADAPKGAVLNARIFLDIQREYGSFDAYIWGFTGGKAIIEDYRIRTTSPLSDAISADLRKRGMKFMGSTTIYAYLQAIGIINAHGHECYLCKTGN